jgi:hypothetical protein
MIPCGADSDCASYPGNTCSIRKYRGCFTDNGVIGGSVTATGTVDPPVGGVASPVLGAFSCQGISASGAVNSVAGYPGLARLIAPATMSLE